MTPTCAVTPSRLAGPCRTGRRGRALPRVTRAPPCPDRLWFLQRGSRWGSSTSGGSVTWEPARNAASQAPPRPLTQPLGGWCLRGPPGDRRTRRAVCARQAPGRRPALPSATFFPGCALRGRAVAGWAGTASPSSAIVLAFLRRSPGPSFLRFAPRDPTGSSDSRGLKGHVTQHPVSQRSRPSWSRRRLRISSQGSPSASAARPRGDSDRELCVCVYARARRGYCTARAPNIKKTWAGLKGQQASSSGRRDSQPSLLPWFRQDPRAPRSPEVELLS